MTIDIFIERLDVLKRYMETDFTKDVLVYGAQDMVSDITNRVREKGILGSGNTHPYKDGKYKEERAEKGMRTESKNYEFTGEMWQGFRIKETKPTEKKVVLGGSDGGSGWGVLGGRKKRPTTPQNKINWNSNRDGESIIAPNEQEERYLADFVAKKLKERIDATLGSH